MTETLVLKALEDALEEVGAIPLWGTPPSFPMEEFGNLIEQALETEKLSISTQKIDYLPTDQLIKGMGQNPHITPFSLSPLPGNYFFILPSENKKELVKHLLYTDHRGKEPSDQTLEDGFFKSLLLTACGVFGHLNPYGNLNAVLEDPASMPEEGALCIDLTLHIGKEHFSSRVVISKEAHASFKTHFAMERPPLLADPTLRDMLLPFHLEAGSTTLSAKEWKGVSVGDFILLDRCTYDFEHHRGTAQLTLGNQPIFDVRIKDGEVKILEHAKHLEEPSMIDDSNPDEHHLPTHGEEAASPPPPPLEAGEEDAPLWSSEGAQENEEEVLSSKNIPLSLTVEVGRFKMPLAKLTQLKAGNVLDLALGPNLSVHLTLAGKRVAKGELVKIGDGIGVKVLKVGD